MMSTSASRSSLAANASPIRRTAACSRLRSRTATSRRRCACSMRLRRSPAMQQQQAGERQDEQDGQDVALGHLRGQKADRREARVDEPHEAEDVKLQRGGDPARGQLAQHRRAGVERAAGGERARQQREIAQVELGRARQQQDGGGPDGVPRVGNGEQQAVKGAASTDPVRQPPQQQPGGDQQRHDTRRHEHQHRDQHQLRGQHVARADRELDAREQRVEPDQHRGHRRVETARSRPGARAARRPAARNASAKTISVTSSRRGSRRPLAVQESSRRRSAAASLRMSSAVLIVGLSATGLGTSGAGGSGRARATGGHFRTCCTDRCRRRRRPRPHRNPPDQGRSEPTPIDRCSTVRARC